MPDNSSQNTTPLSGSEYKRVGALIYDRICSYPNLPDGCEVDYQGINGVGHLGFLTAPGGKILKRYVTGAFQAQLPFEVLYKVALAVDNSESFNSENLVDDIAEWLEERPYPSLSDERVITQIVMDSVTYRSEAQDDGSVVFVRNGSVIYEKG